MESTQEEAMGSNSSDSGEYANNVHAGGAVAVVKGKRTKRQRMTTSQAQLLQASVFDSSSASSAEAASGSVTEEEEDMANCLILLAQGRVAVTKPESAAGEAPVLVGGGGGGGVGGGGGGGSEKFTSRRFAETATTTNGKAGYYVYECKTCNKCFPSFQALGGHRASHKKPKVTLGTPPATAGGGDKKGAVDEDMLQISMNSFAKQMAAVGGQLTAGAVVKPRVHECSICGAEFNSGQALGGHMRRHRPLAIQDHGSSIQEAIKKDKNVLVLDLNLPAPSDVDDRAAQELQRPPSPAFSLNSKRPLFLSPSASALVVDCHY